MKLAPPPARMIIPAALAALSLALSAAVSPSAAAPPAGDRETGSFAACVGPGRVTCVVDGDTFWYRGLKIRIADINAPELGHPSCAYELRLAEAATRRLTDLLNAGPSRSRSKDARRIAMAARCASSCAGAQPGRGAGARRPCRTLAWPARGLVRCLIPSVLGERYAARSPVTPFAPRSCADSPSNAASMIRASLSSDRRSINMPITPMLQ